MRFTQRERAVIIHSIARHDKRMGHPPMHRGSVLQQLVLLGNYRQGPANTTHHQIMRCLKQAAIWRKQGLFKLGMATLFQARQLRESQPSPFSYCEGKRKP